MIGKDEEEYYLFGYGSLLNKKSFEFTLERTIPDTGFHIALLKNFKRTWTLCHHKDLYTEEQRILFPQGKEYIVYLNIEPCPKTEIYGTLVRVSMEELLKFDEREINYRRIEVSPHLTSNFNNIKCYTYIGEKCHHPFQFKECNCIILKEYIDIIEEGLLNFDLMIRENFEISVEKSSIEIISISDFFKTMI